MPKSQDYSNHVRWYPLFHFVLFPILVLNFLYAAFSLYQEPTPDRLVWLIMSIVFMMMISAARLQALKVQDRVIRLEEKLRYRDVLTPELREKAKNLRIRQVIALRFASDDELADLIERTLDGEFENTKAIKQAIQKWQGDHVRV